jgi:hypothetical protein
MMLKFSASGRSNVEAFIAISASGHICGLMAAAAAGDDNESHRHKSVTATIAIKQTSHGINFIA